MDKIHYQFSFPIHYKISTACIKKCLAMMAAHLRRRGIDMYTYLDDWLVKASTFNQGKNINKVTGTLTNLGFSNYEK